jgi:hypothetical protein
MQIRLSWQVLLAILIFCSAVIVLGFTLTRRLNTHDVGIAGSQSAQTVLVGTSTDGNSTSQASGTPSQQPQTATSAPATATPKPSSTATPTNTATPTVEPSATPTSTIMPTPTSFVLPTREPTPAPQRLVVDRQGFGQRDDQMSFAFTVANPNPNLLARNTLYQVAIYDAAGTVLRTDGGVIAVIGPGRRSAVADVISIPTGSTVSRIEVQLRDGAFATTTEQPLDLPVDNLAFIQGDIPRITGVAKNPLNFDIANLAFVGIAYDRDVIIGGGTAIVPFIAPQGQAAIDIPIATSGTPDHVEIYPLLDIKGSS